MINITENIVQKNNKLLYIAQKIKINEIKKTFW